MNQESINQAYTEEPIKSWLDEEEKAIKLPEGQFEKLPSPEFADGKITSMNIDCSTPFQKWTDQETKKTKALIPCSTMIKNNMQKATWWVNLKNPIYRDVIHKCKEAPDKTRVFVQIMQIGTGANTRYKLVKE